MIFIFLNSFLPKLYLSILVKLYVAKIKFKLIKHIGKLEEFMNLYLNFYIIFYYIYYY